VVTEAGFPDRLATFLAGDFCSTAEDFENAGDLGFALVFFELVPGAFPVFFNLNSRLAFIGGGLPGGF